MKSHMLILKLFKLTYILKNFGVFKTFIEKSLLNN